MEDLVAQARAADARLASVREGAVPAGDPDPYREPPGDADGCRRLAIFSAEPAPAVITARDTRRRD